MDIDGLAVVHVLLDGPEAASRTAGTALSMAAAVSSTRVTSRLRRTTQLAQAKFPRVPAIAELAEQVSILAGNSNE